MYKLFYLLTVKLKMLLLSLITTETVQVSTENLSPHVMMTSLADIRVQDQDNCRKKSYQFTALLPDRGKFRKKAQM